MFDCPFFTVGEFDFDFLRAEGIDFEFGFIVALCLSSFRFAFLASSFDEYGLCDSLISESR